MMCDCVYGDALAEIKQSVSFGIPLLSKKMAMVFYSEFIHTAELFPRPPGPHSSDLCSFRPAPIKLGVRYIERDDL
jgi:hypothetical protein